MVDDNKIKDIFFTLKENLKCSYLKIIDKDTSGQLYNYLITRYNDCTDIKEILWRIKLGYDEIPVCPICKSNKIRYRGTWLLGYAMTCSKACRDKLWHLNLEKTIIKKYGVKNVFLSELIKDKIKLVNLDKFGYEYNLASPIERAKYEEINLLKYGVRNGGGSKQAIEKIKQTCLKRYGVTNPSFLPEVIDKIYQTKLKHHTFRTSNTEELAYQFLCDKYNKDNVIRLYKSKEYPFACDFYIVSEKLYIECNFHWSHGPHPYNESNTEDLLLLLKWSYKNTLSYNRSIEVWTKRDPAKINTAKLHNLNYKVYYNLNKLKEDLL